MSAEGPLVPVFVAAERPEVFAERRELLAEAKRKGEPVNEAFLTKRPAVCEALDGLDLRALGVEPRWVGDATDDCLAALEPSIFTGQGAEEQQRLLLGAKHRGEPAITFVTLEPSGSGRSLFRGRASVMVSASTTVQGETLGRGSRPRITAGLSSAEADLARRVLNTRTGDEWWALSVSALGVRSPRDLGPDVPVAPSPEGQLLPLLKGPLGEPVMAVWLPRNDLQRVYVLPPGHDLSESLKWLVEQGLAAYAPASARALRLSSAPVPDEFLSAKEREASLALDRLQQEHQTALARVMAMVDAAKAVADARRDALLYGQSKDLETAVAAVFRDAGCAVTDLDEEFGNPASADLLVQAEGSDPVLVEVKSTKGPAAEDLMSKLVKHLEVWRRLRPDVAVTDGLLVVNHHRAVPPDRRPKQVFSRPEFVAQAPHPVVSSADLLAWWLQEDWASVRAVVGGGGSLAPGLATPAGAPEPQRRRWWRRQA